jgi:hypothetical protein
MRHLAADLFIDGFVYGAHSTATDALRGGLPVLTLKGVLDPAQYKSILQSIAEISGDGFPSRVCWSLLRALEVDYKGSEAGLKTFSTMLVAHSIKDFELMAHHLIRGTGRWLSRLHAFLAQAGEHEWPRGPVNAS